MRNERLPVRDVREVTEADDRLGIGCWLLFAARGERESSDEGEEVTGVHEMNELEFGWSFEEEIQK